ncbi:MAG: hypothetical protein HY544_02360 [Candidatus Diapherotrites archaeon]|uniref:Uncharacterized protein n=1 Tax=Candidatus Iainarchaeum sp. TaxID=3101447 RepID=A0A8T3YL20_9ARCH|nr:hypothetical protein [Candidatus Diapherotrites archaeon]
MTWHDLSKEHQTVRGEWGWAVKVGYSDRGDTGKDNACLVLYRLKHGRAQFKQQIYIGKDFWKELFTEDGAIAKAIGEYTSRASKKKK